MKAEPTFTNRVAGRDFFSCERYYRIGFNADFCKRYPSYSDDYDLLSPILPNSLRTIPLLTCLTNTRLHWTLPWHQRCFTSCIFLPFTTSKSHLSEMSHCLVLTSSDNLHRLNISHLFDAGREDGSLEIVQSERNSVPFTPPWWRRSCCMLNCKMADQLSTSWTLDIFHSVWRRTKIFDIYCRMPKTSFISWFSSQYSGTSFPQCTYFKGPCFDSLISFFVVFRGLRGIGSDGGTSYAGSSCFSKSR